MKPATGNRAQNLKGRTAKLDPDDARKFPYRVVRITNDGVRHTLRVCRTPGFAERRREQLAAEYPEDKVVVEDRRRTKHITAPKAPKPHPSPVRRAYITPAPDPEEVPRANLRRASYMLREAAALLLADDVTRLPEAGEASELGLMLSFLAGRATMLANGKAKP